MIDWQKYNDMFQWYGKEVEIELIEVYQREFEDRMSRIAKNVKELDFEQLKFNVHSLKGTISNYYASEPVDLAKELEVKAKEGTSEGLYELFERLEQSSRILLEELLAHRVELLKTN